MQLRTSIISLCLLAIACTPETTNPGGGGAGTGNLADTTLINVAYGSHPRQVFDIYLPKNRDAKTPVLFMIHGGAWKAGQKEDLNGYMNIIKAKWNNVALVNLNYRLASNAANIHHNEIMADIQAAVTLVNNRKSTYAIGDNMGIMGASAGAQLAMIYAYKYNRTIKAVGSIFGPTIINDWEWYNSTNLWLGGKTGDVLAEYVGQKWDTTAYKAVSPYWQINSTSQPTIIFHGSLDPIVPVYQSQWMRGKLNTLGVPSQYFEYPAFHSFDANQSSDVLTKMVAFFQLHIK